MDIQYLFLLQNFRFYSEGVFNDFFSFITTLGESFIPVLLMAAVYWCFNKKAGTYMCLAEGVGGISQQCVKNQLLRLQTVDKRPGDRTHRGGQNHSHRLLLSQRPFNKSHLLLRLTGPVLQEIPFCRRVFVQCHLFSHAVPEFPGRSYAAGCVGRIWQCISGHPAYGLCVK